MTRSRKELILFKDTSYYDITSHGVCRASTSDTVKVLLGSHYVWDHMGQPEPSNPVKA